MTTTENDLLKASAPVIKVNGTDLAAATLDELTSLRVERAFCTVSRTTLRFRDFGYAISTQGTLAIGKVVDVHVYNPVEKSSEQVFSGEIVSVALEQGATYVPELVVVADDKLHRLARTADTATFQKMKASDIITKAARAVGLSADVAATTLQYDYLIQGGSHLAYLDRLASRSGLVWWCDYPSTLRVAAPDAGSTTVPFDLNDGIVGRTFSVRASARNVAAVKVTGWDLTKTEAVRAEQPAQATSQSSFTTIEPHAFGTSTLARADLAPQSTSEAETLAKAINADATSQMVTARGTTFVDAALKPGVLVHVTNAGPASGKYRVTAVEHRYDERGFTTTFTAGPLRGSGLVDLLARPAPEPGLTIDGLLVGIVTQVGKEASEAGLVKVKLPSLPGEPESAWGRVLTVGGGNERGALFLPEVNDEVLVAFERGDTRRPVVLGGLFSKKNAFPGTNPVNAGKIEKRRIRSRAGHVLELSDEQGKEYVLLEHGTKKHTLKMSDKGIEMTATGVGGDIVLKTDGATLTMTSDGQITIKGNGKITVQATQDLTLDTKVNLKAKAGVNAEVEATASAKLKGGPMTSLEGSGMTVVKGSMVKIN